MSNKPVALVTGASRGIGRGIAIELASRGFDIAGNGRTLDPANKEKGLYEVKTRVEELGARFLPVQGDVSNLEDHSRIVGETLSGLGRLDMLVNNAGVAPEKRLDVLETTPESFDRLASVNLRGPFFLTQMVARHMIEMRGTDSQRRLTIVFVTSVSAHMSSRTRAEYCISKAGLSMAASVFADLLSEHRINVYEVRPGVIKTDMTAPVQERYDKMIEDGLIPQGRWGMPEDVARVVAALADGTFDYATGIVIEVSGGMNIRRL
jgi:NAD(P)-dependent dehydrogenase (short-subunit alcohol dehydrogenase family)